MERRINRRFSLKDNYYYVKEKSRKKIPCLLENISITGACIISESPLTANDIIMLHFPMPREINIKSQIVWEKTTEYGLLFVLDTSEDFENISYIMNNRGLLADNS